MVDSNSPTFKAFEKIGFVAGKILRFSLGIALLKFLGRRLIGSPSTPPGPSTPNGPTPPPSSLP